ncbi:MAG: Phosphatidylinositol-4-phosphate 5-kinase [Piccolia ochrophora]|nr:MAG: Phosphatidylinositol-4-phosphate 5-kinase [Piccolia ochrophora]
MAKPAGVRSTSRPSSPPLDPSYIRSNEQLDGASIVEYQDEREKRNSSLQLAWSEATEDGKFNASAFYENIAVLLIYWDKESNDLNISEEVETLQTVFETEFHYDVSLAPLKSHSGQLAQVQVNYELAQFVYKKDGPKTLLIVYYAGHGTPGRIPGRLELSGKRTPADHADDLDVVIWNNAELTLQNTLADIFEIFDCCYAGDLGRGRAWSTRKSEFLGATSAGSTTPSAGIHSFTAGLIWALQKLAKECERFTTSELANKIREAPNFPKDQVPTLLERNTASVERIILSPLVEENGTARPTETSSEREDLTQPQEVLDLKFVFEQRPSKQNITDFAKSLNWMLKKDGFRIRRVLWGGIDPWPPQHQTAEILPMVFEAVNRLRERAVRRRFKSVGQESSSQALAASMAIKNFEPTIAVPVPPARKVGLRAPNPFDSDGVHDPRFSFHLQKILICTWTAMWR